MNSVPSRSSPDAAPPSAASGRGDGAGGGVRAYRAAVLAACLALTAPVGALAQDAAGSPIPPPSVRPAGDPTLPFGEEPVPGGVDPLFPGNELPDALQPYAPSEAPGAVSPVIDLPAVIDPEPGTRLLLSARLTDDGAPLRSGLVWRVFGSTPGPDGELPLVADGAGGATSFPLEPGVYFVYCGFGHAASTTRVELREGLKEETVVLGAGGLRLRAAAEQKMLGGGDEVVFDIYSMETDDRGERKVVARDVLPDDLVRLAADTYHVVSRYGQVNAQTRADVEVKAGKLTEVTLYQRAARVTLKLVGTPGGEAIADTSWSVLTPGGDIVTEGVGAFPSFVLASGEYTVMARHDERVYHRDFNVETGRNAEVEVLAQD